MRGNGVPRAGRGAAPSAPNPKGVRTSGIGHLLVQCNSRLRKRQLPHVGAGESLRASAPEPEVRNHRAARAVANFGFEGALESWSC